MAATQDLARAEGNEQIEALAGELRELRRRRGLTLERLAAASGVSRSMISKIERGDAVPSTMVLSKLAEALGVTFGELMLPAAERELLVIPAHMQPVLRDPACGFSRRVLSPVLPGRGVDFVLNQLDPGGDTGDFAAHRRGVEEYIHVQSGRLEARVGRRTVRLEAGDSLFFEADQPHGFANHGDVACVYFLIIDSARRR